MSTVTFNTHTYIKRLMKKGMSEELAEEVASGMAESREKNIGQLVTKDYLDMKLKAEISEVRTEMHQMGTRLIMWFVGTNIALAAIILGFLQAMGKV